MTDIIACLICGQQLRVPKDRGDLSVRCPKCGYSWDWSPKNTGFVMKTTGLIVQPDDLEIGQYYAIHSNKHAFDGVEYPAQNAGLVFRLLAINLPFVVGKFVCNPACYPFTFDCRWFTFMRVSDEFVKAQRPDAGQGIEDFKQASVFQASVSIAKRIRFLFPRPIYNNMLAQATAESPNQCCGLLGGQIDGSSGKIERLFPLVVETSSPVEYRSALKDVKKKGLELLAIYHSRPNGSPFPSQQDIESNLAPEVANFIISLKEQKPVVKAWWLTSDDYEEAGWEFVP
jgi:[CysO sulfur-carrier protein]-S-L-cysteine hydrolase